MQAHIDLNRCSGHARCAAADEEVFQLDDVGYALRAEFDVPSGAEQAARLAAASCPERAITLTD
ncbi:MULTISPECIES: ferredoxin [Streptacidiphilus]|uniref:Ferredoxin n=2 Tax=Streptacidiphilus TaxID=228398 RepID=A0ABV6UUV8_9ACTN|nr:ferredoxin [Streptacidiphilus jeojiense]